MIPIRIKLGRTLGWRMPANTAKVDRTTKHGNPFKVGSNGCKCRMCLVVTFEHALTDSGKLAIKRDLAGKNVGCWCPLDGPCHGDVLLAIANDWDMRTLRPCADEPTMPDDYE